MPVKLLHTQWETPLGPMEAAVYGQQLCLFDFVHRKNSPKIKERVSKFFVGEFISGEHELFAVLKQQFEAYLRGRLFQFDLPLAFSGSDFQNRVWEQLLKIPYGETWSYTALTKQVGEATLIRAVAGANGANCMAIVVPCHRVVGANGNLVGYAGGLTVKRKLLNLEREHNPLKSTLF